MGWKRSFAGLFKSGQARVRAAAVAFGACLRAAGVLSLVPQCRVPLCSHLCQSFLFLLLKRE